MLTPYKDRFRAATEGVARLFLKCGFSPNGITVFGLAMGWLTCFTYVWYRNAALFGFLMIVWGLFDAVDGAAARIAGRVTKFGSYLDAMCDRLFEAGAVLAGAYVSGHWVLSFLVLTGSMLISYAKARAAMEVSVSNTEWPDLMERTERGIVYAVGLILWGFFPQVSFWGKGLFFWTLAGLSLALYFTFFQRFFRARRIIEART